MFGSLVVSVSEGGLRLHYSHYGGSEGGLRVHYSHYEGAVFLYGDFACTTTSAHSSPAHHRVHYSHYGGAVFLSGDFACTTTSAH